MAPSLLSSTPYHYTNKPFPRPFPNYLFLLSFAIPSTRQHLTPSTSTNHVFAFPLHPRRQSAALPYNAGRCFAAKSGPPLPPPESDETSLTGLAESFSKFQDKVQIFFAVLFWMSLFFWASVCDERNRPDKGSRFRR